MKAILDFIFSDEFIFSVIGIFLFSLLGLVLCAAHPTTLICGVCFWAVAVLYIGVFVYVIASIFDYEIEIK